MPNKSPEPTAIAAVRCPLRSQVVEWFSFAVAQLFSSCTPAARWALWVMAFFFILVQFMAGVPIAFADWAAVTDKCAATW